MKRAATAPVPALSAMPATSAMVPAHLMGDGITSYTLTDTEALPSPAGSGRTMTDMAGIADAERPAAPKVARDRQSKTGGRQKGTPNRITADIRVALRDLAERNADRVQEWLDRVAEEEPADAMRLWLALLRFVTPTLAAAAIADVTPPKRAGERLAMLTDADLLDAIIGSSAVAAHPTHRLAAPAVPTPDPDDEELLR